MQKDTFVQIFFLSCRSASPGTKATACLIPAAQGWVYASLGDTTLVV